MRNIAGFAVMCAAMVVIYVTFADAVTSPELTARYQMAQRERTARALAAEETARVQAVEFGATLRTLGTWAGSTVAVAVVAGAAAWAAVQWQRERTSRHGMTEHRLVALAWIAAQTQQRLQDGAPRYRIGTYAGQYGVMDDAAGEFTPWQVAAAELPLLTGE